MGRETGIEPATNGLGKVDPATREPVPRIATITSDDGLCRLAVEEHVTGTRLTGDYCSDLEVDSYSNVDVSCDNREIADRMVLRTFSDGDDV